MDVLLVVAVFVAVRPLVKEAVEELFADSPQTQLADDVARDAVGLGRGGRGVALRAAN